MEYKLLAKRDPDQSLRDHSMEVLDKAKQIINSLSNIPSKELILASLLASAFHDLGKADYRFQNAIKQAKRPKVWHPFLSLAIAEGLISEVLRPPISNLTLLAIASHHSPLTFKLYDDEVQGIPKINHIDELRVILIELCKELNLDIICNKLSSSNLNDIIHNAVEVLHNAKLLPTKPEERRRLREGFIFIQGVLMQADWLASSKSSLTKLRFPEKLVRTPSNQELNHYQELATTLEGNAFITLPTGCGKTETSLFWARANNGSRLFYVLPTMTTINAMHQRLKSLWQSLDAEDEVGFYHSRAEFYLAMKFGEPEEHIFDELKEYKYFFSPVNVTTPDQLILSLMNYKKYTLKSFPLRDSLLVFDEIHAYDEETLGMIKGLVKHLIDNYRCKICMMSATFPSALKTEFSFLSAKELLTKDKILQAYSNRRRTSFEFIEDSLMNEIDSIIKAATSGKKILVVLNTVKKAQEMYRALKPIGAYLLHSRYTFEHRMQKEATLLDKDRLPPILISTQIIEVSLDIDYDSMYTEACYPDSLVQRLGRVNRRNRFDVSKVFVFSPESHWPYTEKLMDLSIDMLKQYSNKISSELDYLKLSESFYAQAFDHGRVEDGAQRYERIWECCRYIYSVDLSDMEVQKLLKTRSGFISIPAYPACYESNINELNLKIRESKDLNERRKLRFEKIKHLVEVPLMPSTASKIRKNDGDWFIDMEYDGEYGLRIDADVII
ncbi:MAG: CRISPR-associated helicase Cas3' [Nitrososphaerales archaeon]